MPDGHKEFGVLLKPSSVALAIVDHQEDFLASLSSSTRERLARSTDALARIALACDVSVVISCLATGAFRGRTSPRLLELFPPSARIRRETINCWDDSRFAAQIHGFRKERLLIAGLWTETGVSFAALSALELGYDVFLVTDACAGMSAESHATAIQRMVQSGAVPITWRQVLFEWYRSMAGENESIARTLIGIATEHGHLAGGQRTPDPADEE